jgi:hypothetical protein
MAARLERRLLRKPAALPWVLLAMGYYMQIRYIYQTSGLWEPALGEQPKPVFAPRKLGLIAEPRSTSFSIL